jgi:hypothetical protein
MAVGFTMIGKFFFEHEKHVAFVGREIEAWGTVIAAMAYLLGIANLTLVNGAAVMRRGKDWVYKLVLLIGLFGMVGIGVIEYHTSAGIGKELGAGTAFGWVFRYVMTPLIATMFSLLAFFIASAAFRAFRARSLEATLMLIAGILVMAGRVPLGNVLSDGWATDLEVWIMNVPSLAGQRAIIIGAALGLIGSALRVVLGIERPYLR